MGTMCFNLSVRMLSFFTIINVNTKIVKVQKKEFLKTPPINQSLDH